MKQVAFQTVRRLLSLTIMSGWMAIGAPAMTSVNPAEHYAWASNIGWIDFRADGANGAVFNRRYATGYLYAANVGWINLGGGRPANGRDYSNTSASDFGVNVEPAADGQSYLLTGLAWGANIGWINFDVKVQAGAANQPRIDKATGTMKGFAWSANAGWIALESPGVARVRTELAAEAKSWALYE